MAIPTSQLPLPLHLQHQPVFAIPFFEHDPGREGDTDCQHLSVGWSQWNDKEISAKAIRHGEQKWSRQAEELPLPRLADLLSFVVLAAENATDDNILIPAGFFENQPRELRLSRHGGMGPERELYRQALVGDEVFQRRLDRLTDLLVQRRRDRDDKLSRG